MADRVDHPPHYTAHPSGVECITVTEHMNFCLGNAVKYIWRADQKGDALEDLRKARWYIDREISRRQAATLDDDERLKREANSQLADMLSKDDPPPPRWGVGSGLRDMRTGEVQE